MTPSALIGASSSYVVFWLLNGDLCWQQRVRSLLNTAVCACVRVCSCCFFFLVRVFLYSSLIVPPGSAPSQTTVLMTSSWREQAGRRHLTQVTRSRAPNANATMAGAADSRPDRDPGCAGFWCVCGGGGPSDAAS